jgi:uncharacterized protein YjbI with pentapeptide repeats
MDLEGANFYNANLFRADLEGANLSRSNFDKAVFEAANLSNANLTRANLSYANCYSANLQKTNLIGANLIGTSLTDANLDEADLRGAVFEEKDEERKKITEDTNTNTISDTKEGDTPVVTGSMPSGAPIGDVSTKRLKETPPPPRIEKERKKNWLLIPVL